MPLYVAVNSLLKNKSSKSKYKIYVLYKNFSSYNQKLVIQLDSDNIEFIDISNIYKEAGIIIDKKNGKTIAPIIEKLLNDNDYKNEIIKRQKERLSTMTLSAHADEFIKCLYSVYNLPVCCNKTTDFDLTDYKTYEKDDVTPTVAIERISELNDFIVYGYGKIGKYLVSQFSKYNITNMIAICDNNLANKKENDFKILTHRECVNNHSSANYIITVQRGYLDIIYNLISDGISKKQIFLYDNARKRIEEFNS